MVTLVRPGGGLIRIRAHVGETESSEEQIGIGGGLLPLMRVVARDFVIATRDCDDINDRWYIEFAGGRYQIMSINGEKGVVNSGRFGNMIRIHAKRISDAICNVE